MPTIGEFNRDFAEIIGAEFGSVLKVQRVLRGENLFTTGARGVNAPDVTTLDAARMLLAFLVTDRPSLAKRAVVEFGGLGVSLLEHFDADDDPVSGEFAKATAEMQTLEEGLVAVIEGFARLPHAERADRSGAASVSCVTNDMSATLHWPGGLCIFSNQGSWMEVLAAEGADLDARRAQLAQVEAEDRAAGAKYLVGARRVRTDRKVSGDVLAEVAGMFAGERQDA